MKRRTDRVVAASGALLLQLGFIAAFVHAFSTQAPPRQLEHELTFFLPRLLSRPAPLTPAPRAPSVPESLPVIPPPLRSARPAASANDAAILQNLGHSLFGCAPENYSNLTPQQRAACPRLGEGVAIQDAPNPMNTPSHAKDEAHWKEALRQKQAPKILFGLLGAYGPDTHMSIDEAQVEEMTTWDPCPQIVNVPCLYNAAKGLPQPGAAGAPPSIKGQSLH